MLAYVTTSGTNLLLFVIAWFTFGLKVFALADACLRPANAFAATSKQTKQVWLAILGVTVVVGLVVFSPLSFLNLIGDVAAIVYLVDVRPAIRNLGGGGAIRRRKRGGPSGGW